METVNPTIAAQSASPEVFQQLGLLTRQLHDTLAQLGVMPKLQQSVDHLPDAKSRLNYVAEKTRDAAEKVLDLIELTKAERGRIDAAVRHLKGKVGEGTQDTLLFPGDAQESLDAIEQSSARIDAHLTDMMLAQDFHDLTGQVVAKVITLATDLEDSLVKLLVQSAPVDLPEKTDVSELMGPVIDAIKRDDAVSGQSEVDDLLATLGF